MYNSKYTTVFHIFFSVIKVMPIFIKLSINYPVTQVFCFHGKLDKINFYMYTSVFPLCVSKF
jgi:hypothetical protein